MKIRGTLRNWREFHSEYFKSMLASPDRKSLGQQAMEATLLFWRYRHPPAQYLKNGLYLKTAPSDWESQIPWALIRTLQSKLNPKKAQGLAEDKRSFRQRMEAAGLPTMREVFAIDADGSIRDADGKRLDPAEAEALIRDGDFFAKPIDGNHGKGTELLHPGTDLSSFRTTKRNIIVQPRVRQHPLLAAFHPHSINTVRIDTLRLGDRWVNNAAVLRIGVGGSITDNNSSGGIVVGIDLETGMLKPHGRQKPLFSSRILDRHPDTDVVFDGIVLPHWALLRETVARAAEAMLPLQTLGWDVVITEEGVLLLEANHDWGSASLQLGWGGLADTPVGRMACELHGLKPAPVPAVAPAPHAPKTDALP